MRRPHPDWLPHDPAGVAEAKRALKLAKRAPTDEDRPRARGKKPIVLDGQTSVFDFLDQVDARRSA